MIKIAIISDIHGNLIALDEVLKDIQRKKIDQIYCLGDLVDFAPWGNEVIEMIRSQDIPCILGNHDERIAYNHPIIPLQHHDSIETINREKAINFSKITISDENKNWLAKLPSHLELGFKFDQKTLRILLLHASVTSNDEYVFESDSKIDFFANYNGQKPDAVVMGHTHLSYVQNTNEVLFINCGSVGRSREKDRKATYAILTISKNGIEAEICKTDYSIIKVAQAIYESEIPNFYGDFLIEKN